MPRKLADLFGVGETRIRWERLLLVFTALLLPEAALVLSAGSAPGEWPIPQVALFSYEDSAWMAAGPAISNLALVVVAAAVLRFARRPAVALPLMTLVYVPLQRLSNHAFLTGMLAYRGFILEHDDPLLAQTWAVPSILSSALWVLCVWGGVELALRYFDRLLPALVVGLCGGQSVAVVGRLAMRGGADLDLRGEVISLLVTGFEMLLTALLLWGGLRIAADRPADAPRGSQPLSRGLFLGSVLAAGVGANVTGGVVAIALSRQGSQWAGREQVALGVVAAVLALYAIWAVTAFFFVVYRMWAAIQDGNARTSPGRAVGLLFVPLFGLYWAFQVFPGFATDFNGFAERQGLELPKLTNDVFTAFAVLTVVGAVLPCAALVIVPVHLVVTLMMVSRACDAVNAARAAGAPASVTP